MSIRDVNAKRKDGLTPLHIACFKNNIETVQFLTSSTECNIEAERDLQSKPLHLACHAVRECRHCTSSCD